MSVAKVAFVNLGCRVNRVEVDVIAAELERASCEIVGEADAEAIVINTCAVTGEAEAKTRKAVRHAASLPQAPVVVATGCVANLFEEEMSSVASNVIVVRDKSVVAKTVLSELGVQADVLSCDVVGTSAPTPTGRTRPGIKIQDGCDNRCTYCIVWKARGPSRSMGASEVLDAVGAAVARGAHEVVLTGINLGRFEGCDPSGRPIALSGLLELIMRETEVERVRLSSIEPPDVTDDLLGSMARHGERIAPFLHVCLQSGCDRTLGGMGRVYDTSLYRSVVSRARAALPDLALGTDLIVGFPGETDADFEDSLAFCREMGFAKMHVFRYSRRPGTPAATAEGQVDPRVMAERSRRMRDLARQMRHAQAAALVGSDELVLVQYPGRAVTGGLFDVRLDPSIPVDSFARVRVSSVMADGTLVASTL